MARRPTRGGKTVSRFEGTEELLQNLDRYEKRIVNKHLREGYEAAGEIVRSDAEGRAPVLTGHLEGSMLLTWVPGRRYVKVGPAADAYYGEFQEFGTSRHAAQPFLRPALDSRKHQAFDAIAGELSKASDWLDVRRGS